MVEEAEKYIISMGFKEVRVRCQGTSARIEIPSDEIHKFINSYQRDEFVKFFFELGFKSTSLDLEGLVSGKLNR